MTRLTLLRFILVTLFTILFIIILTTAQSTKLVAKRTHVTNLIPYHINWRHIWPYPTHSYAPPVHHPHPIHPVPVPASTTPPESTTTDPVISPATTPTDPPIITTTTNLPITTTTIEPTPQPTGPSGPTGWNGDGYINPATLPGLWQCIVQHESNGYNVDGTEADGYFQFLPSTWAGMGQSGIASDYSFAYQFQIAQELEAQQGWAPWSGDGCV